MALLEITDTALEQFRTILKDQEDKAILFGVNSGGCSGFSYQMDIVDKAETSTEAEIVDFEDVQIHIDNMAMMFVVGTEIDYKIDLLGAAFSFSNPNSKNQCGCGTSFSA